jgi:hypothetical protein
MPNSAETAADPLDRARAAYSAGNFAQVRLEAELARKSTDAEAAEKARELEARVAVDPWIWAVLGAASALFCGIVVAYAH